MHVSLGSILKAPFKGSPSKGVSKPVGDENHTYIRGDIECRGPCPGLNALANQGYLPRDGQNISLADVHHALQTALHMSNPAATSLTDALKPLLRSHDKRFDLPDLRRHNVVEHDASFTRLDFHQGDNYTFQPEMFEAMMHDAKAENEVITLRSIARTWNRRTKESRDAGAPSLSIRLWVVAALQAVSVLNVAKTELNREVMEAIYVEERFPDVVLQNPEKRTLLGLVGKGIAMVWYSVFA